MVTGKILSFADIFCYICTDSLEAALRVCVVFSELYISVQNKTVLQAYNFYLDLILAI